MICLIAIIVLFNADGQSSLDLKPGYIVLASIHSPDAIQAACVDAEYYYAISSTTVSMYDRCTLKRIGHSTASDVKHLNAGFLWMEKVYCAHSNYPLLPENSDIRVFDPKTKSLTLFHRFGTPPGSLVWVIRKNQDWYCCFAHYGTDNAKTVLVRMDSNFRELQRWKFPKKVIDDWDGMSASGGIFDDDTLLISHHHYKVLYRLRLPKSGDQLELIEALTSPFPGQAFARDPLTNNLVGISRPERSILIAQPVK